MSDTISVHDNQAAKRYEAKVDGHVAVATYSVDGSVITFIHTVVPEELRGRGVGTQLVRTALADVRARGLTVIPQCPMFAAYMKGHADTHDLLAPEGRQLLGLA